MKLKALPIYLLLILLGGILQAQNPQAFKYQAVARDNSGYPIIDSDISLQIKIYTINGSTYDNYIENHYITTNSFGLLNLNVGTGEIVEGDFSSIEWAVGEQYIEISIDIDGGTNFQLMGSSQILSVPMANYAAIAGNVVDTSLTNELQRLDLSHLGILTLSPDGDEVDLAIYDDSEAIHGLGERITNDSIYFEGELVLIQQNIDEEVIRATQAELDLANLINQNSIAIINDSLYFQNLIDNLNGNNDSLYFKTLIDANTQKIIADSLFLKSLIDQNNIAIQQEITRAIMAEAINTANINTNTIAIYNLQTKISNDSAFLKALIDQNTIAITAEITRAILAEITNTNNISANALLIAQNSQNIYEDSTNFQTQLTLFDYNLQQEITRSTYRDEVFSDSILLIYSKLISDSIYFQAQIDGLAGGGLDPTLENGKIFIGNASNVATGVNMTGDAQITNTGSLFISPAAITTTKVADGNITNNKLANSTITISDDQGNSGQIALGNHLQFNAVGATSLHYNAATSTMDITSTDNQLLSL
ncbi:MAG: hypothetical protein GQ527_12875, partial [Bacteroidales bacterium]|nr:hypothetical protein [Bacteroidales bacterium]